MAAIALVGEEALEGIADEGFHVRDDGCERMPVIGLPGSAFTWVTN